MGNYIGSLACELHARQVIRPQVSRGTVNEPAANRPAACAACGFPAGYRPPPPLPVDYPSHAEIERAARAVAAKKMCKTPVTDAMFLKYFFRNPETGPAFFKEWESRKMQARTACPSCSNDEIILKAATVSGGRQLTESEKLERAKEFDEAFAKNVIFRELYPEDSDKKRYIEMTLIDGRALRRGLIVESILDHRRSASTDKGE